MKLTSAWWLVLVGVAGCPPPSGPGTPNPGQNNVGSMQLEGCTRPLTVPVIGINQDEGDVKVRPGEACVPGAVDMVGQHVDALAGITLDADNVQDSVAVCVQKGEFRFHLKTLVPLTCAQDPLPASDAGHAKFTLAYLSDVDHTNPVCVARSKVAFESFSVTDWPLADAEIQRQVEPRVRDQILQQIDDTVAARLDWLLNHPTDPSPPHLQHSRCADWQPLP